MRNISVIGIGTGNPDHLTLQAVKALNRVDVVFVLDKGSEKSDLAALRREICARVMQDRPYRLVEAEDVVRDPRIENYAARVDAWHERRSAIYERMFREGLSEEQRGAILVWGDPCLYDSTLRILERIARRGHMALSYEVITGITSVQALAASHKITLNRVGSAVHITTGRRLAEDWAKGFEDVIVMLDGDCAFQHLPAEDVDIYWGAFLGSPHELLFAGKLSELSQAIVRARAQARAQRGWIMDTYLLRRARQGG